MNILNIMINIVGNILEAIIIALAFDAISKCLLRKALKFSAYVVFVAIQSVIVNFITRPIIISIILLLSVILLSLIYRMSYIKRIVVSILLTFSFILTEVLIAFIASFYSMATIDVSHKSVFFFMQYVLGSKLLLMLFIQGFRLFASKNKVNNSKGMFVSTILLPLATIFFIFAISELMYVNRDSRLAVLIAVGIMGIISANFVFIYFAERNLRQVFAVSQNQIMTQEHVMQTKRYKELLEKYKIDNRVLHDIDKQFIILRSMINADGNRAEQEINKVGAIIDDIKSTTYTGIVSIDAILNNFANSLVENIQFHNSIFFSQLGRIDEIDLSILLGNLLDNALEECLRIDTCKQPKIIACEIKQSGNYINIVITNSKRGGTTSFRTSKSNKYKHGYGLKIINDIVNKYDGNISYDITYDKYSTIILLKIAD